MTTDTAQRESVSIEAHNRVTAERDELKQKVAELSGTVTDIGLRDKAETYFTEQGIANPKHWAEVSLPHLRTIELDAIPDTLAAKFADLPKSAPSADATVEAVETPAPIETSRPSVAGPNPASSGSSIQTKPQVKFGDREYQNVYSKEGLAGIRRLEEEGRFDPSARAVR